ncbi:CoxG family protein [Rubrivivax rivuli]|uniref:Carbon monoxide dehydrogenase n=1 Tax=Rubrivivax rivuli TaxID=1862385 RepID=A0A437RRI4_9BURK|nr:SRPBCC family protein [Rubrivivax rivuli]RVU49232.1 carbon monoxide dehydrogenase [Rubrivivax rivuli]
MEVKLDKRYPVAATPAQAWAVLSDIHAIAACMPGAAITEQLDETHFKGTVKSKIGPAVMSFGGDIELQGLDAATRELKMLGKGADKAGSSASMQLTARLEPGEEPGTTVLMGQATITVSGKLAQFGSRLLVPVSDAMLAQFADNFRAAAAAVPVAAAPAEAQAAPSAEAAAGTASAGLPAPTPAVPAVRAPVAPAQVKELNALGLMWTVFKGWLAGLFGKKS